MHPKPNIIAPITRYFASPVRGIAPVQGWTLCQFDEDDSDGFTTPGYIARSAATDVPLDTSRFRFTPSQDRFAWLVRNGFPARPHPMGGWDDTDIEHRLTAERRRGLAA